MSPKNQNQEFVISGKVLPAKTATGSHPSLVRASYPPAGLDNLCRGGEIAITKINWVGNIGTYQIVFRASAGLNAIALTTDCDYCDRVVVSLKSNNQVQDLSWGNKTCMMDGEYTYEDKEKVLERANLFTKFIDSQLLKTSNLNESERQSIRDDISRATEENIEANRPKDANESILHAYYAEWYATRAEYRLALFSLKYCLNDVAALLKVYKDDGCYVPDYGSFQGYLMANNTFFSLDNSRFLEDTPYGVTDLEKMKFELIYAHNKYSWISEQQFAPSQCLNSYKLINATFEFQKPYCEGIKTIEYVSYLFWSLALIYLGILIGRIWDLYEKRK